MQLNDRTMLKHTQHKAKSPQIRQTSRKGRRTIAHDSSFLIPKIMAKFERDHPLRGRQMQVGWVKIGHFR